MEYINNHVFNGNINEGVYQNSYLQNYGKWVYSEGVDLEDVESFTKMHFQTVDFGYYESLYTAIDAGAVIMTDVPTPDTNITHNVVIIGYQPDGDLIYMNPQTGHLETGAANGERMDFTANYGIIITGVK